MAAVVQNSFMAQLYISQGNWSHLILRLYQTHSVMLHHYGLLCSQSRLYLRDLTHVHHISLVLFSQIHTFLYVMMQFVHHCKIRTMDRSKLLREGIIPLNSLLMGNMSMCQLIDLNQRSLILPHVSQIHPLKILLFLMKLFLPLLLSLLPILLRLCPVNKPLQLDLGVGFIGPDT